MATFKDRSKILATATNIVNGEDVESVVANRPHDQAFSNTDLLALSLNADRNMIVRGGFNTSWTSGSRKLAFSSTFIIELPNEEISPGVGGATTHIFNSVGDSITFGALEQVAAVKLSRTTNSSRAPAAWGIEFFNTMALYRDAIHTSATADQDYRFTYFLICALDISALGVETGNVILWDGSVLRDGFSRTNSGSTDSQYAQQSDYYALRIRENQDRNLHLVGGGTLEWAGPADYLHITSSLYLISTHGIRYEISAASLAALPIGVGECYYILAMNRADDAVGPAVLARTTWSGVSMDKTANDFIVIGYVNTDNRLYLMDGTVMPAGSTMILGGLAQGLRWMYTASDGVGGAAPVAYDFATEVTVTSLLPVGANPEYRVGGCELQVFVNGKRQTEGIYCDPGGGDYEEVGAVGTLSTTINWVGSHVPDANDRIVAFVGLAVPNLGYAPAMLSFETSGGAPIGTIDLTVDAINEDALYPTVALTPSGANMQVSVGEIIADPVMGLRAQGTAVTFGALRVFGSRPQVHWYSVGTNDTVMISPGEIALPFSTAQESWVMFRLWQPLLKVVSTTTLADSTRGIIYFYMENDSYIQHDSSIAAAFVHDDALPPVQNISAIGTWLAHPTHANWIYIGCVPGYRPPAGVTLIQPFTRIGDRVRILDCSNDYEVLSDDNGGGGWGAVGGTRVGVTLADFVPKTAQAVTIAPNFFIDMTAYVGAGTNLLTGLAFYSFSSTMPVAFPASLNNIDYDVRLLENPNYAAAVIATQYKFFGYAPFDLPINDHILNIPQDPTFSVWIGPWLAEVILHAVGWVEDLNIYRFGV